MSQWEKMSPDRLAAMKAQSEANLRVISGRIHRKVIGPEAAIEWHQRQVALSSANLANWQSDPTVPEDKIELERRRLAESLMIVGEIDQAIEIAPDDTTRAKATALKEAVEMDDDAACNCPATQLKGHTFLGAHSPKFHIRSKRHGKIMPVYLCSKCGHTNVTETDPHSRHKMTPADERRLNHASDADRQKFAAMHQAGLKARQLK